MVVAHWTFKQSVPNEGDKRKEEGDHAFTLADSPFDRSQCREALSDRHRQSSEEKIHTKFHLKCSYTTRLSFSSGEFYAPQKTKETLQR